MKGKGIIKVKDHGCAYYIEGKNLMCAPICQGGSIDMEGSTMVEESPEIYKDTHQEVLRKLDVVSEAKQNDFLKQIKYYEED